MTPVVGSYRELHAISSVTGGRLFFNFLRAFSIALFCTAAIVTFSAQQSVSNFKVQPLIKAVLKLN